MGFGAYRGVGSIHGRRRGAFVLALLLLGVAGCATNMTDSERPLYAPSTYGADRFVRVGGYNIHYVDVGAGRPILLIPGAFTTYRAWNRVVTGLSLHARVLAVDYVGIGDSDKPEAGFDYTVEEQADVMAEMLRTLRLSDVTVVGASYGGAVALNLVARHPGVVNRVVCIEGGALITPAVLNYNKLGGLLDWPLLGDIIWGFMQTGLFDGATARSVMGPAWVGLTREERQEIVAIVSANIKTATRSSWIGIYRAITRHIDFMDALERSRARVLYLYGGESKYRAMVDMNVERFERHGANIEIVPFPGGIHDLHLQYPDAVSALTLEFLARTFRQDIIADADAASSAADGIGRVVE